tara:strand:- start:674 stop:967 length:294 start_codon:yes stop_codon:yes gene_type:complete
MSTQPSLEISSIMSVSDTKQLKVTEHISEPSQKQLTEWSTPTSISQLKLGDIILHEGQIARVTFTCQCYVVVTPKYMQYGVLVFPEFLNRVKQQVSR